MLYLEEVEDQKGVRFLCNFLDTLYLRLVHRQFRVLFRFLEIGDSGL